MSAGAGGVKDKVNVGKLGHAGQTLDTFVRSGHAHAGCARQAIGVGVDADHGTHFDMLAVAQNLDHQVCTNVAAADDGGFEFARHSVFLQEKISQWWRRWL